jgi:long-chain fatty acid transport protein
MLMPVTASAGGLYLNEFATPSMSTAGAGAEAQTRDATVTFHNPAAMTELPGNAISLGGGLLYADVRFDPDASTPFPGSGDGGDAGAFGPILSASGVYDWDERVKLGLNLTSISAALLEFDEDWAGRYQLQDLSLITLQVYPSLAFTVTDWLSLGVGPRFLYGHLDMDVAIPLPGPAGDGKAELEGLDDFDAGVGAGALIKLGDDTRVGINYLSEIELDLEGDVKLSPPGANAAVDTKIPFVQMVQLGVRHQVNDAVALLGTVTWEDWSEFGEQFITVTPSGGPVSVPLERNWDDVWGFAVGAEVQIDERWRLMGGFKYDLSPVGRSDRTADLPVDRQIRGSIGAQYDWSDTLEIGGSFVYMDAGDAEIQSSTLVGEFERNQIFFFAVNANWVWPES